MRLRPARIVSEHLEEESTAAEVGLTRDYLRWCERTGRPGDCLHLLTESPTVNGDGRFALALALARGAVLDEMLEAFKDMADPHAMVAAVREARYHPEVRSREHRIRPARLRHEGRPIGITTAQAGNQ